MNIDNVLKLIPELNEEQLFNLVDELSENRDGNTDAEMIPALLAINTRLDLIIERRKMLHKYLR